MKSALFYMVTQAREQWNPDPDLKKRYDALLKSLMTHSSFNQLLEILAEFISLLNE